MFDNKVRFWIDPAIDILARKIAATGISANTITVFGFITGMAAAFAIALERYDVGIGLILISRLADGLDGAVARVNEKTDLGGFLDITLDFFFYGMIPLAFAWSNPQENALAAGTLIFTFYTTGASFLAFALMAEKRGTTDQERGSKSLVYTTGLAEATETIVVFIAFCIFPEWFAEIAYGFALLCLVTVAARIWLAVQTFSD